MTGGREPGASVSHDESDYSGLTALVALDEEAWADRGLGDLETLSLRALRAAAHHAGLPADIETEASLTFSSDVAVAAINAEWRGKDGPTNVLSFPMADLEPGEPPGPILGDIVLSLETLEREAEAEGKSLHDHLCHMIVHGFLHCLGFDHEDADEAEAMERLEIAILSVLGIGDPYAAILDNEAPGAATPDSMTGETETQGAPRRWAS